MENEFAVTAGQEICPTGHDFSLEFFNIYQLSVMTEGHIRLRALQHNWLRISQAALAHGGITHVAYGDAAAQGGQRGIGSKVTGHPATAQALNLAVYARGNTTTV